MYVTGWEPVLACIACNFYNRDSILNLHKNQYHIEFLQKMPKILILL